MKICIDPGHGGKYTGAQYQGFLEKDVTLRIARLLEVLLSEGNTVVMTRNSDIALADTWVDDLMARYLYSHDNEADLFVSIHCNADRDGDELGDPEARGEEVWYKERDPQSHRLASMIGESFIAFMNEEPYRGEKAGSQLVLRMSSVPAVIIECGFIDNSETAKAFHDVNTLRLIAFTISEGIKAFIETL